MNGVLHRDADVSMEMFTNVMGPSSVARSTKYYFDDPLDRKYLFKKTGATTDVYLNGSKTLPLTIYINPIVDGKPYNKHKVVDISGTPLPPTKIQLDIDVSKLNANLLSRKIKVAVDSQLRETDNAVENVFLHE